MTSSRPGGGSALTARERLRAVTVVYRRRATARPRDTRYALYVAALLLVVVGVPLARGVVLALARPEVVEALRAPGGARAAGLVAGLLPAALAVLGQVRGPALLDPFFVTALAGNDLPRHRTLRVPFLVASGWLTIGVLVAAALLAVPLTLAPGTLDGAQAAGRSPLPGSGSPVDALPVLLAALATGALSAVSWLAGQRAGRRAAWVLPAALGAGAILPALPGLSRSAVSWVLPAGWFTHAWPSVAPSAGSAASPVGPTVLDGEPWWGAGLLVLLACLVGTGVPRLLDGLRGGVLLDQARRWSSVTVAVGAGDLSEAGERLGLLPSGFARRRRAVRALPTTARWCWADLVGALRTPGRLVLGSLLVAASGGALAVVVGLPGSLRWWCGGLVAAVCCTALGPWSDGLRHAAEAAAAPPLYGCSTTRLFWLRSLLPAAAALVLTAVGVLLSGHASSGVFTAAPVLALLLVLVRVHRSARGGLPPSALTPVPTPAGDLAGVLVLAWNIDWALLAGLGGVASVTLAGALSGSSPRSPGAGAPLLPAVWCTALAGALLLLVRARLRRR